MSEALDPSFDTRYLEHLGALPEDSEVFSFENPRAYSRSIRATALVFEDPNSKALQARLLKLAPSNASVLVMNDGVIDTHDLHLADYSTRAAAVAVDLAPATLSLPSDISNGDAGLERTLVELFEGRGRANSDALYAEIESRLIRCAYEYCQSNQLQTARLLGISRNILRHRLKLYGYLQGAERGRS